MLRTGEPRGRREEVWVRGEGAEPELVYVDSAYLPVRNESGGVIGVLIFGTDVSDRVWDRRRLGGLAERLARSEGRYRNLFETLPLGILHLDADGSILDSNPAAGTTLGLQPPEMITWPLPTWSGAVREDGSAMRRDDSPVMKALRTGHVVRHGVFGVPHGQTGELRWLRMTAFPDTWEEQGGPRRAYAIFADVTEQRHAEARLREANRLLERLRDANVVGVVVGTEEVVQEANDGFVDIVGYGHEDLESGGMTWDVITPAEWAASDADALDQLRLTGVCTPYEKGGPQGSGYRQGTAGISPASRGTGRADRGPR